MTTLDELIASVPIGEGRIFPKSLPLAEQSRFLRVAGNHFRTDKFVHWGAGYDFLRPFPAAERRGFAARGFDLLKAAPLKFDGRADELTDFHDPGLGLHVFSKRLADLVREHAEPSMVEAPVEVTASDRTQAMVAVLPSGVLDCIDIARTTISIEKSLRENGAVKTSVKYPEGISVRDDIPETIHVFRHIDATEWLWSRELLERCREAGVEGLRAEHPNSASYECVRM